MTNFKSIAGASIWTLVSTLLMFAALEPASMAGASTQADAPAIAQNGSSISTRA